MADANPIDAALSAPAGAPPNPPARSSNPIDAVLHAPSTGNPIDAALGAVGHVGSALTKALAAPEHALRRIGTHESDPDKQQAIIRKAEGWEPAYQAAGKVPFVGHLLQGTMDAVSQTLDDPLMGLSGPSSAVGHTAEILSKVIGAGVKAVEKSPGLGGAAVRSIGRQTQYGYDVGRTLGPEARDTARAATNVGSRTQAGVTSAMQRMTQSVINPLSDESIVKVGEALNKAHSLADLKPEVDPRELYNDVYLGHADPKSALKDRSYSHRDHPLVGTARTLGDTDYGAPKSYDDFVKHLGVSEPLSPQEQRAFLQLRRLTETDYAMRNKAAGSMPGIKSTDSIARRQAYLPGTHVSKELADNREAFEASALHPFDPRTLEREEIPEITADTVRGGFGAMSKNLGLQMGAARIRDSLGKLAEDPEIQKLFTVKYAAKGTERTDWQKLAEGWKSVIGYPRAAIVSLTPRHVVNILDLVANTDPGALPETMKLATQLVAANPKKYEALTKEGREMGALSGQFTERKPFFADMQKEMPGWTGAAGQAFAKGMERTFGKWSGGINKLTWAVDDAAKQIYAKRIMEREGVDKLVAGGRAARELVDYAHVSPLIEKLRYVAPFATFRGSIPGAVLGGVARNPARASAMNRATGGAMYGTQAQGDDGKGVGPMPWYAPTSDVGQGIGQMANYFRGTVAEPVQGAITVGRELAEHGPVETAKIAARAEPFGKGQSEGTMPSKAYAEQVAERERRWATYRNPVDYKWLLNAALAGIPEAQTFLQLSGYGPFKPKEGQSVPEQMGRQFLWQSTGLSQGQ